MSQISKCPNVTVVLTYLEASGEVSELRYKSLLYCSSKRSYCRRLSGMRREGWEVSRMRGGAAASSWIIVLDLESRSLVWDGLLVVLRANGLRRVLSKVP